VYSSILVLIVVLAVLDQASPALMPNAGASKRADLWSSDAAFVAALQERLPHDAMVFQLPVVDFPEHGSVRRMSAHDLIKEGYLHSSTLRWSAGGVRGRDGEWQFPAADLPMRDLVRGVTAMGFSALMIDRFGFRDHGNRQVRELTSLLGEPISEQRQRLVAWDLRPAHSPLLRGMTADERDALVRKMLDAPRLYMSTDVDPLTNRGEKDDICGTGSLTLVNPGSHHVQSELHISFRQRESATTRGHVTVGPRTTEISVNKGVNVIPVDIAPGDTDIRIAVGTPDVRCKSVPGAALPSIAVKLVPAGSS
jgi:hypothetical protein